MTTVREKAPSILTAEGARRITARIRDALAVADDLLARAYEGRVWEALGHDSWADWCAAELPELAHVKLRAPERRERAAKLLEQGASVRDIVAATGSTVGTAHRDIEAIKSRAGVPNGTPSPAAQPSAEPRKWEIVARQVAAAGERGLTCLELEKKLKWRHGSASGAFRAAELKGHIRRDGRFREQYGTYVMR